MKFTLRVPELMDMLSNAAFDAAAQYAKQQTYDPIQREEIREQIYRDILCVVGHYEGTGVALVAEVDTEAETLSVELGSLNASA